MLLKIGGLEMKQVVLVKQRVRHQINPENNAIGLAQQQGREASERKVEDVLTIEATDL